MARKKVIVVEEHQEVEENLLVENYSFVPSFLTRFFVSNVLTRGFAHLIAWSESGAKRLLCTTAGILKVAVSGSGFEHNDTTSGNAPDTYGTAIEFDSIAGRVDIWITGNAATVKRSNDGLLFDDEINIPVNNFYSFECTTHSINIKNTVGGSVAAYSIVGWF